MTMGFTKLLAMAAEVLPEGHEPAALARLGAMGRLRLAVAWAALILVIAALILVVAYVGRVFRRQVRRPLSPTRLEEDAWARKPLAPPDEDDDETSDTPE
jgi:hypothetical protein